MINFQGKPLVYSRGQQIFSVKDEIRSILGFAGYVVAVPTNAALPLKHKINRKYDVKEWAVFWCNFIFLLDTKILISNNVPVFFFM